MGHICTRTFFLIQAPYENRHATTKNITKQIGSTLEDLLISEKCPI